jgi:hypothetical protein
MSSLNSYHSALPHTVPEFSPQQGGAFLNAAPALSEQEITLLPAEGQCLTRTSLRTGDIAHQRLFPPSTIDPFHYASPHAAAPGLPPREYVVVEPTIPPPEQPNSMKTQEKLPWQTDNAPIEVAGLESCNLISYPKDAEYEDFRYNVIPNNANIKRWDCHHQTKSKWWNLKQKANEIYFFCNNLNFPTWLIKLTNKFDKDSFESARRNFEKTVLQHLWKDSPITFPRYGGRITEFSRHKMEFGMLGPRSLKEKTTLPITPPSQFQDLSLPTALPMLQSSTLLQHGTITPVTHMNFNAGERPQLPFPPTGILPFMPPGYRLLPEGVARDVSLRLQSTATMNAASREGGEIRQGAKSREDFDNISPGEYEQRVPLKRNAETALGDLQEEGQLAKRVHSNLPQNNGRPANIFDLEGPPGHRSSVVNTMTRTTQAPHMNPQPLPTAPVTGMVVNQVKMTTQLPQMNPQALMTAVTAVVDLAAMDDEVLQGYTDQMQKKKRDLEEQLKWVAREQQRIEAEIVARHLQSHTPHNGDEADIEQQLAAILRQQSIARNAEAS